MSFRNAFKLLLTKFSNVWVLLVYFIILSAVVVSLGLTSLIPVFSALREAGIYDEINHALVSLLGGASLTEAMAELSAVFNDISAIFASDTLAAVSSTLFVVLVLNVAFRFLLGLYELPLVSVIRGFMSDNARYGFTALFVSLIGKSARFSLLKMAIMTVYDTLALYLVYGLTWLGGLGGFFTGAFLFMLSLIAVLAFRFTLISAWAPSVIVEGKGVCGGFAHSLRHAFRNFGSLFSTFTVAWIIVLVLNFVIGLFTFLVGLLVTVPASVFLFDLINMTSYYGKTSRNYYVDGTVISPPPASDKHD